jgi:hypothetical protein
LLRLRTLSSNQYSVEMLKSWERYRFSCSQKGRISMRVY